GGRPGGPPRPSLQTAGTGDEQCPAMSDGATRAHPRTIPNREGGEIDETEAIDQGVLGPRLDGLSARGRVRPGPLPGRSPALLQDQGHARNQDGFYQGPH